MTRLLTKKEADARLATENHLRINEGIGLARKVDTLRSTALDEEKKLANFRDGVVKQTIDEIAELVSRRDALQGDVGLLEANREKGMEPVLRREASVAKREAALAITEEEVAETKDNLRSRELRIETSETETSNEWLRVQDAAERTAKLLHEANVAVGNASNVENETYRRAEKQNVVLANRSSLLDRWEVNLTARERDSENRTINLEAREQEVNERERRIADREATLQRNLQRHG